MKILAFAASNNKDSINQKLVIYFSKQIKAATESAPFFGADVKVSISVPSFFDNFDLTTGEINNLDIKKKLKHAIEQLVI